MAPRCIQNHPFLERTPTPFGLMVASDQFEPLVIEAAHRVDLAMPEQLAIVSVDNDLPFRKLCHPRLTSIEPNHQGVAYEAAKLLDRFMNGDPIEPSVNEVARLAGFSRSFLQRRFREQLGRTVGEALLQVRLRRACDMLAFTDLPLLDVAERSGFNYQQYLSQVFKRHLQTTPAHYRKEAQGGHLKPNSPPRFRAN